MDFVRALMDRGFARVIVLDGHACGVEQQSLLLALWFYDMEAQPAQGEAWIHPYYRISHQAYQAARSFVEACQAENLPVILRDDVRLKPIMARLTGFSLGRNTLSYVERAGSRFYVKTFSVDMPLEPTHQLEEKSHEVHCGSCRRCMEACPTGAIQEDGFHIERCIRYWMMPGKPVPEDIRAAMGNRLIGCDECQRCCPHNTKPTAASADPVPLMKLLTEIKPMAEALKSEIGVNLTLPNRLLAQSCMIAGCSGRKDLLPALQPLCEHPSEAVREHACWAVETIQNKQI